MNRGLRGPAIERAALDPEEIKRGLNTKRLGIKIHYFTEIDSTNAYAYKIAKEGAEEGEIVIAEGQKHGKGRMGRSWISPEYLNLYLSVVLRPRLSASHAPQLTLMSGVALAETVESLIPDRVQIKWPNDILIGGRKLAGILSESSCEGDRISFVVVGIGVNLNFPKDLMPEAIKETATSVLNVIKAPVDRQAFAQRLIRNLDRCYGDLEGRGFAYIAGRWETFFHLRGKKVKVELLDGSISGRAVGIDLDGALLLENDRGLRERIMTGDVIPIEP